MNVALQEKPGADFLSRNTNNQRRY